MPGQDGLLFNRPGLFSSTTVRTITEDVNGLVNFQKSDFSEVVSTSLGETGSFKYDLEGMGVKSTQQLNIGWDSFENHTFFNSAQVKVQTTFDKIINNFPFDGTKQELERFFSGLTGYEKYIYDTFPKNKGFLFFSGTRNAETSGGTYITTKDIKGATYPTVSRYITGNTVLDPQLKSMTIEFQLFLPATSSTNQVILQKVSGSSTQQYGFSIVVNSTSSIDNAIVGMTVVSGTQTLTAQTSVSKGSFNHLAFIWNRNPGVNRIYAYLNQNLVMSSSAIEFTALSFQTANLFIGSGSAITNSSFTPQHTLSGALDELRIWHSIRSISDRKEYEKKSVYADDNLKLYYKFNEPSGSNSVIVLDHSNNSLHGSLSTSGYNLGVREVATGSLVGTNPMTYEKLDSCPVLFSEHEDLVELRDRLLVQAIEYDNSNPNLITNLIPKHYIYAGQAQDALLTEEGSLLDEYESSESGEPRTLKIGNTQVLLSLLWTWAKFFDELKLHIQSFGDLLHVDYDSEDTTPDQFLQFLAKQYGITLPSLFSGASIGQFIDAENIDNTISNNDYSLQYIQNQIWRRILINLRDILSSKGTIHSVKSFIRTLGIDPDNNFRIREYGGPTTRALAESRESKTEVAALLNFVSGGLIRSPFLSGSRTEPGYPYTTNDHKNDGLFTSGSWTYEAYYRFPTTSSLSSSVQSLMRMMTTGSHVNATPGILLSNLTAYTDSIRWYSNFGSDNDIVVSASVNVLDGSPWYVSVGRIRGDQIGSNVSSSFFLRAAKVNYKGELEEIVSSSVYANDNFFGSGSNYQQVIDASANASGTFIEIGKNADLNPSSNPQFANIDAENTETMFEGRIGQIRFWSKALEEKEWKEHARNFKSLGVQDPMVNFNFIRTATGSWERLRMDISADQQVLETDGSGRIMLFDFSQNNLHWSGSSFPLTSSVIVPQRFYYSHISPKFDEASTTNKVRVRSFLSYDNILDNETYAAAAPVYEIERSETPTDNTRFSIDFSIVDALNQDIINIFSTLDVLDNAIGAPELVFSPDYPQLDFLRTVYFNRLTDKINLKNFFEFYKWFDGQIGPFISSLIPRKTRFLGVNFVIEPTLLERSKIEYFHSENYLGPNYRHGLKGQILLQQIVGTLRRY